MKEHIVKLNDFYQFKPGAKIVQSEFGFYCLERWKEEGYITENTDLNELFGYYADASFGFWNLGWCEAAFSPGFDEKELEDRGEYKLIRDVAGRSVLYFKGSRQGYMPQYVDHPVKDAYTWEKDVKWRLDPESQERFTALQKIIPIAVSRAQEGFVICQRIIGGYMYLRSLIGPEDLLYKFSDEPELIHDCMKTWLELADKMTAETQKSVALDELFFGEDICYNCGLLISPDMVKTFLFPYYQQLISNVKKRQSQKKKLFIQVDTDGNCLEAIGLYRTVGMDHMSPFEVASGCDVVDIRKKHPDLLMRGGIDKRILAESKDAIDRELDRIMPFMTERGGYIPTCDHCVPAEVPFENYTHYRERMSEY